MQVIFDTFYLSNSGIKMGSIFYCTELSVSCWYCNANEGNLHLVISKAPEAILYNFGEYEETDIKEEDKECENENGPRTAEIYSEPSTD